MAVLIFMLVLSVLIFIHELGHFLAARWAGIRVKEFGIGYPPLAKKVFSWQGTDFTLNWIPFGGFVRMDGEDGKPGDEPKQGEFYAAPAWKRLVVILAGATVNFVFGVVAFSLIFSVSGIPVEIDRPQIGYISPNSPAAEANLPQDRAIVGFAIEGERVETDTIEEVISVVSEHPGQTVSMIFSGVCQGIECSGEEVSYDVYLRTAEETPDNQGSLGIGFAEVINQFYPWYEMPFRGAAYGLQQAIVLGQEIFGALERLGSSLVQERTLSEELAGPVGIVHQASTLGIFEQGALMIVLFAGLLSINLAIMNVLPIPPLDGGKAVFILLELVVSQARSRKIEYWFSYAGWVLLMGLIGIITIRDIARLFS